MSRIGGPVAAVGRRLGAVAVAVALAACGSPQDADLPPIVGDWQLVGGTLEDRPFPLVDDRRITMGLDDRGGIGGVAACNGYGGRYVADAEDVIVSELSSTSMACEPEAMESEQAFLGVLRRSLTYSVRGDVLEIETEGLSLRFERVTPVPAAGLIGTVWVLESLIRGDTVSTVGGEPAVLLLSADGRVSGSTGCRRLEGSFVIEADVVLFTTFSALGECPAGLADQDGHVVTVLGDGFTVEIDGGRMTATSSGGDGLTYRARGEP